MLSCCRCSAQRTASLQPFSSLTLTRNRNRTGTYQSQPCPTTTVSLAPSHQVFHACRANNLSAAPSASGALGAAELSGRRHLDSAQWPTVVNDQFTLAQLVSRATPKPTPSPLYAHSRAAAKRATGCYSRVERFSRMPVDHSSPQPAPQPTPAYALQVTANRVHPELRGLRYATLPARFNWRRRAHVHCMCMPLYTALRAHYPRAAAPSRTPQPKAEAISRGGRQPHRRE